MEGADFMATEEAGEVLPPKKIRKSRSGSSSKRRMAWFTVVALLLIAGLVVYLLFINRSQSEQPIDPLVERIVTEEIDARLQVGDDDGALELIENMIKKYGEDSPEAKALLAAKARVFLYQGKDNEALELYLLLESDYGEDSYGSYLAIATLSEKLGKIDQAKQYYTKALKSLDKNDPLYEIDKTGLQEKIDSL